MNLQKLIDQYIGHRQLLGEQQGSNAGTLRAFGRAVGGQADVADVRAEQVNAFLAGTGPRTLTWHIKLSVLRPFYRYAVSRGYVAVRPCPSRSRSGRLPSSPTSTRTTSCVACCGPPKRIAARPAWSRPRCTPSC